MQVQQKQALKRVENAFISFRDKLKSALPQGYDVDREISSILATVASSTALQRCTPESILMAAYNAATLGLPVNSLGLAYLVPYGNEAKFQIGYQGQLHLMYQTEFVGSVDAEVVYEKDYFEFTLGSKPTIEHKPCKGERGKITHAYAIAHLANGLSKQ
ncbi:MAG: recombination protein RecT, partial [bacterium]